MKIVIMAGGKGTRITSINAEVPKPMIPMLGKPILEYGIDSLKKQGYVDFILVVGHLGTIIMEYFGDGTKFGVKIEYIVEEIPLGTAGALYFLKEKLTEDFLLLNGDIIFDIDIKRFYQKHKQCKGMVTIVTHPNSHPYDSGVIIADEKGCVKDWLHKEEKRLWYKNRVNAGIHFLSPKIFDYLTETGLFQELKKLDLDRDILKPLLLKQNLFIYDSSEYIKDMGTPERFYSVLEDIKSGKVQEKNLLYKQKAVFLDRDGTINKYIGFLKDINQFELLPGAAEAIKKINNSGYLAIVITNQPVIARGEITEEELQEIHNKMETLLGQEGAYFDAIYYCPHHPDKGYEGEVLKWKIHCDCRKPKPGMILKAARDFHIDLGRSWIVGDSKNDIKAGKAAGCKTVLIGNGNFGQELNAETLLEAVNKMIL